MSDWQNDTQPTFKRVSLAVEEEGIKGPPKALLWGAILIFVLVVVGIVGGIVAFREVLRPSQQQRVLEQLPFMRAFLPPTPSGGLLPTVAPDVVTGDAASLLTMPLAAATPTPESTSTPEPEPPSPTPQTAPEITEAAPQPAVMPSATPEPALPTATTPPQPGAQGTTNVVASSLPAAERIVGFRHEQQDWNNCGPATLTMALSYFGWTRDQQYARGFLRPNREDKNVSPEELADFVNTRTQVRAIVRMGGSLDLLKALIANRFPVIVERGIMFEAYDWVGHYQLLVAYDDTQRSFYAFDSFLGTGAAQLGVTVPYQELDEGWRAFNRTFLVVYNPADEAYLQAVLGDLYDPRRAAQIAFEKAQAEAQLNRQDGFAWFNMGTSLVALGEYEQAARAFDLARQLELPWRMLWYQFGPFEAYYNTRRYDDVLSLAQTNLNSASELEESYYWRGRVYEAQGNRAQAIAEYNRALSYNSNFTAARAAAQALQ
jgi:hypothetical protein